MHSRLGLLLLCAPFAAQAQEAGTHRPAMPSIAAQPVQRAIVVDGRLDEPDWTAARPAQDFTQCLE